MKEQITKDTTLGEVIQKNPSSAEIMMEYGLHCVGCHIASYETIEQGAKSHGLSDDEINEIVGRINKLETEETGDD